jgi:excisionase family DNA binding protein
MDTPIYEPVVGAEQVAEMLGCSGKTVLRLAKTRQIPAVQIGKLWRFRRSVIDAWLSARLKCDGHPRVAQEEKN